VNLINELAACLAVAAFAQLAGGIHDFGRQALFSVLDDKGPRIASFVGLGVGVVVAFSTLLLPPELELPVLLLLVLLRPEVLLQVFLLVEV